MRIGGDPTTVRLALGLAGTLAVLALMEVSPATHGWFEPVNVGLARATEWLLGQLRMPVAREEAVLAHPDGFSYRITYVCSGLRPIALVAVTVLLVPAAWSWRLWGLVLGIVGVEAVNLCRLLHLYWIGVVDQEAFFVAHRVTWNIVAVALVGAFLLWWLAGAARHGAGRREHTASARALS